MRDDLRKIVAYETKEGEIFCGEILRIADEIITLTNACNSSKKILKEINEEKIKNLYKSSDKDREYLIPFSKIMYKYKIN